MNALNNFFTIFRERPIDKVTLSTLYALSVKNMLGLIASSLLLAYLFYTLRPQSTILWEIMIIISSLLRLYLSFAFEKNYDYYSLQTWHILFRSFALLTAFLIVSIIFIFFPYMNVLYQMFVIAVLISFTASAMHSLSLDIRLAISYISLIILPLLSILLLESTTLYTVSAILLGFYYLTQISIMRKIHRQIDYIKTQEEQISILQEKELLFDNLFVKANISIFFYDTNLCILECNQEAHKLFNMKDNAPSYFDLRTLKHPRMIQMFQDTLHLGFQTYIGDFETINKENIWIEVKCFPYADRKGNSLGGIAMIENKSKERRALNTLAFLAQHDSLTSLLNRRGFKDAMEELIAYERHQSHYSLLFYMDLNRFKGINDSLGHSIGDAVLIAVAQRLMSTLDRHCKVCRLGGDEFIVIVPYVTQQKKNLSIHAKYYEEKIINIFHEDFIFDDIHLRMKASIGIIFIQPKDTDIEEIVRHADITMYQAKISNTSIAYYDKSLDRKQKNLFSLQHDLAYALQRKEFLLFFQPIVSIDKETVYSAEALIRWQHPQKGLLSPIEFIPLAIEAGLLSEITWWVIEYVCQQIALWKKQDKWTLSYISINVNAQQLSENHFAKNFLDILKRYDIKASELMIEITERSLIDNFKRTQKVINLLKAQNVKCAIDDFGIGYSSLSYLKKLSFDTLKIDKEFVIDIAKNPSETILLSTIINIGKHFGYKIVIEGIETQAQKEVLLNLDKSLYFQGYLISKPIDSEAFSQRFLAH